LNGRNSDFAALREVTGCVLADDGRVSGTARSSATLHGEVQYVATLSLYCATSVRPFAGSLTNMACVLPRDLLTRKLLLDMLTYLLG